MTDEPVPSTVESLDPAEQAILDAALRIVTGAPMSLRVLTHKLEREGLLPEGDREDLAAEVAEVVVWSDRLWLTHDDEYVVRLDLRIDGTVFTHRLTEHEVESGGVAYLPDLVALDHDTDPTVPLPLAGTSGGLEVEFDFSAEDDTGVVTGPDGWLDAFAPGALLAFARRGATVEVTAVDDADLADGAREVEQLRARYAVIGRGEAQAAEPDELVLDALAVDRTVFARATRPIGELLGEAGLECRGQFVGPVDEEWSAADIVAGRLRAAIGEEFAFGPCCDEAFDLAFASFVEFDDPERAASVDWDKVGEALVHSEVARALVALAYDAERGPSTRAAAFGSFLATKGPKARAGGAFCAALVLDQAGEVDTAEGLVTEALAAYPDFDAAADECAHLLAEAGEIDRAIELRQRLAFEDDRELAYLRSLRPVRRAATGRNDPCICGSGRKYKACCIDKPAALGADAHAAWLEHKLVTFASSRRFLTPTDELAAIASSTAFDRAHAEEIVRSVYEQGLLATWLLYVDDGAATFLAERGHRLPEIEREMLADWVTGALTLFEVRSFARGESVTLRDTVTDRELVVRDAAVSTQHVPGDLLLAVIGEVGDDLRFLGVPLAVAPKHRDSAAALVAAGPSGTATAQWFAEVIGALLPADELDLGLGDD